jgi:hypothetical protein
MSQFGIVAEAGGSLSLMPIVGYDGYGCFHHFLFLLRRSRLRRCHSKMTWGIQNSNGTFSN